MHLSRAVLVASLGLPLLLVSACHAGRAPADREVAAPSSRTAATPAASEERLDDTLTPAQIELMSEGPVDVPPLPPPPYTKTAIAAFDALRAATSIELFRLDPEVQAKPDAVRSFHGYFTVASAIGRAPAPVISTLVAAAEHGGPMALCFVPHHGVRVRTPSATYDFVICFSCHQVEVYERDRAIAMLATQNVTTAMDKAFSANGL